MTLTVVVSIQNPLRMGLALMRPRQLCNNLHKTCTARRILDSLPKVEEIPTMAGKDNNLLLPPVTGTVIIAAVGYTNPRPGHMPIPSSSG
jgi:hypothetical protein